MKKILVISLFLITCLFAISCQKEDKSVIRLSSKSVSFLSKGGVQQVYSSGKGFQLIGIKYNGQNVSSQEIINGSLTLKIDWLTVFTPGVAQGDFAKSLILKADPNNLRSKRECKVVVANGKEVIDISVTQDIAN